MYCIVQIMYGVPLEGVQEGTHLSDILEDGDTEGLHTYYSGGGDETPAAFGVEIGTFDEANFSIDVSSLALTATPQQIQEYQRMFAALPSEIQSEVKKRGEPRVFFLFTTS